MTKDNGGPAFPVFPETSAGHAAAHQGLSLRDYFAAKAMQSILYSERMMGVVGTNRYEHRCAEDAYKMADAMLEARK